MQQDAQANTWTVWKKDGTRYLYSAQGGTTARADATLRWLLAAVIDTHRNTVTFSYTCDEGSTACYR